MLRGENLLRCQQAPSPEREVRTQRRVELLARLLVLRRRDVLQTDAVALHDVRRDRALEEVELLDQAREHAALAADLEAAERDVGEDAVHRAAVEAHRRPRVLQDAPEALWDELAQEHVGDVLPGERAEAEIFDRVVARLDESRERLRACRSCC